MPKRLEKLSNPQSYHAPIDIDNKDAELLITQLSSMLLIRRAEQHIADMRRDGLIGGPVHLSVGQEAIAVGVSSALKKTDRVFGAHRSHSHLLALGSSLHGLFAEVLGKETGHSHGMGGSMHLHDQQNGFYGSVPIVAGTVSLAVGAAMAATLQRCDDVAVAYFGDGACEEGVVHESLNLAKIQDAPVIFVVENNLFASHLHVSLRQPSDVMSRFAVANEISHRLVDGNDVVAVSDAASELINNAREGQGPGFLEVVTYRWYGHVDWREDIDVGVHRSTDEVTSWHARDPIQRLSIAMINAKIWSEDQFRQLNEQISEKIQVSWDRAMNDPYPDSDATINRVYANSL